MRRRQWLKPPIARSDVVPGQRIVDAPLNGRDVYALVAGEPGVTPHSSSDESPRGEGVSSNGMREASANYMLDGADNNNVGVTGWNTVVALDDVAEYRVLTNNYSASRPQPRVHRGRDNQERNE